MIAIFISVTVFSSVIMTSAIHNLFDRSDGGQGGKNDSNQPSVLPLLKAGFNRRIHETSERDWRDELAIIEHNDLKNKVSACLALVRSSLSSRTGHCQLRVGNLLFESLHVLPLSNTR